MIVLVLSCKTQTIDEKHSNEKHEQIIEPELKDTLYLKDILIVSISLPKKDTNFIDKNGWKQGVWVEYYKNNKIKSIQNYINDTLDGKEQLNYWNKEDVYEIKEYKMGVLDGYQKHFHPKFISEEPQFLSYFKEGKNQWMMFPIVDIGCTLDKNESFFGKGVILKVDSCYVIAPYSNGNTWYEGLFIKNKENQITKKGVHKVYNKKGALIYETNYETRKRFHFSNNGDTLSVELF